MSGELANYLSRRRLEEAQLDILYILDSLACLGFDLVDDMDGSSSVAYYRAIRRDLEA